jgi:hypothetical protein
MRNAKKKRDEDLDDKTTTYKDLIYESLGNYGRLLNRTQVGYRSLILANKGLEHINNNIALAKCIQVLDISNNQIDQIAQLLQLEFLLELNISNNKIKNVNWIEEEEKMQRLVVLNASNNKIIELPAVKLKKIERLDLSFNSISKVDKFEGNQQIKQLLLRDNKLKALTFIKELPKLEILNLRDNEINALQGYADMPKLQKLNLRGNKIAKIEEIADLASLTTLNMCANKINSFEDIQKLFTYSKLSKLNLLENPIDADASKYFSIEILIINPKLKRINKINVTQSELKEARLLAEMKWKKQEDARIQKELEEKMKEEEAKKKELEQNKEA